ncbi:MAG TPA: DUF6644 family protein [Bryobacteraceae bacterium]|nr:DUF6644 family protein [Bryobacteraceae bacterium]
MSLYSIFESIQNTSLMTGVEQTPWVYPIIMAIHLSCIAVFGGMILMTDLRLLGLALRDQSIADVVGGLRPFKRIGFVIMVTCGLLMAGSEAPTYYPNPYFWTKMILLLLVGVHALIFKPIVYDHPEELDKAPLIPVRAKVAAVLSLILWVSIPLCGRLIGYYEPNEGKAPQSSNLRRLTKP